MDANWVGAVLAFSVGFGIAALNYLLSKFMLKKHPAQFSAVSVVRQLLQVAYIVLLFALGDRTPWDKLWLLVGGVLGVTLPMIFFTSRLLNISKGKEEPKNG